MTLSEMVAALERAACWNKTESEICYHETHSAWRDYDRDAAVLTELASLLKGAQEAWQDRYGTVFSGKVGMTEAELRTYQLREYKRVYIVPAEEEK